MWNSINALCQTARNCYKLPPSHLPGNVEPSLRHEDSTIKTFGPSIAKLVVMLTVWCVGGLVATPCYGQEVDLYAAPPMDPYAYSAPHSTTVVVSSSPSLSAGHEWYFDFLPEGLIYRPYLAGPKESRTGIQFYNTSDRWQFDSSIGAQWGLMRYGTQDSVFPLGWQLDMEASAQFRHSDFASQNVLTNDIRFGLPLSFSRNNHKTKLGLYFLRSNPSSRVLDIIEDINDDEFFQREALVLGHSIYLSDNFRIYGEIGYAFSSKVSDKWEFQFGAECAPVQKTGILGAPFLAANAYLREEVDFGGIFNLQAGWAWRKRSGRLFRIGLHYANGKSNHFTMHDLFEQQMGFGMWYDF